MQDLVVDADLPNTIYIGTDLGVMATYDGGASWASLGNGLPKTSVVALALHRRSRTLRAGTHGRSTWDYPLGAVPPGAAPIIETLTPATKNAGDAAFELQIKGTGFAQNAHVFWNGAERTISSGSNTSLTVQIPASVMVRLLSRLMVRARGCRR